jgi:ferrochelatase
MNYGKPSIKKTLVSMFKEGCTKILILPLYPQYSATTTASVVDKVNQTLKEMRWQPTIRYSPPYFDDKIYIEAITKQIKIYIKKNKPQKILASFHGIPKKYFIKGDPYHCHCAKTVRLINESLRREKIQVELSFQSRFGPQEWLKPYMSEKFDEMISKGVKNIAMIAPGFSVDCLETLEEIKIQGKEEFLQKGGEKFGYIDCLNDSKNSLQMLKKMITRELQGWI